VEGFSDEVETERECARVAQMARVEIRGVGGQVPRTEAAVGAGLRESARLRGKLARLDPLSFWRRPWEVRFSCSHGGRRSA
jgi:hypothetical protein